MTAKLFIMHHPGDSLLYKNLIQIIRKYDKDSKIILFKVNHPYFSQFDFKPYRSYFDEIIEFNFINYERNFLKGLWEILIFQKKLKKVMSSLLANFEKIDLFLDFSAYLPINILLYNLSKQRNIKNITRFILIELKHVQTKTDKVKTFLCALYSLPFKCYKVKVISTLSGRWAGFVYANTTPGTILKIVSPIAWLPSIIDAKEENVLPYPVVSENSPVLEKDIVIIFGNAIITPVYSEYLPNDEIFIRKLTTFFKALENKYSNCQLYYKPHPMDGGQIMPGIDIKKYSLFDDTINAQALFDMYQGRIRAIYTFYSTLVMLGSFFGIPSYTFFRYLCSNPAGIEKFDSMFNQDKRESKFLFHIADLAEIGKIDDLECPIIDSKNLERIYRKVLNV